MKLAPLSTQPMMFNSKSVFAPSCGALLLWGLVLFSGIETSNNAGSGELPPFPVQPVEVETARPDTTHPIPVKPCNVVDTSYRRGLREDLEITEGYRSMGEYVAPSLHNITCRWAMGYGHSTDPDRLPTYVQPTKDYVEPSDDSLRLGEDALLYFVWLTPTPNKRSGTIYLVAEAGDSLAYTHTASGKYLRDVREVEVPGTDTRYIWLETVDPSSDSTMVRWRGQIFTYDRQRGIRYAARAPVRFEIFENGKSVGYDQLDVSIPQPGIMKIEWRDIPESDRLPTRLATQSNFQNWVGLHVIDRTETDRREYQEMPTTGSYVVVDSANATAWDRQSEYVMIR